VLTHSGRGLSPVSTRRADGLVPVMRSRATVSLDGGRTLAEERCGTKDTLGLHAASKI